MILLAYILLGHPDWSGGEITLHAAFPRAEVSVRAEELREMTADGRLLISEKNLKIFATDDGEGFDRLVEVKSAEADLVMRGFTEATLGTRGASLLRRHEALRDVLWVAAQERIYIE